ncbi:hypothetical protein MMC07_006359 [Pseudocyphellaria aurata]|nr:hypothetical protein [Pseudocyphellaria aurata]
MSNMVRKHTVEGTSSWSAICDIIERTKEMLSVTKFVARTFVPPTSHLDQIPLGSSSVPIYPGHAPDNHEYGKAAQGYDTFAAATRARDVDIKHPDLEDEIGQRRGTKRTKLGGIREATNVQYGGLGIRGARDAPFGLGSNSMTTSELHLKDQAKGKNAKGDTVANGDNPCFVIGVDPTAANPTGQMHKSPKRSASPTEPLEQEKPKKAKKQHKKTTEEMVANGERYAIDVNPAPVFPAGPTHKSPKRSAHPTEPLEQEKPKKAKKKHKGALTKGTDIPTIEFEDISQEVDARMKEKEAKRKRNQEKKRKRVSDDSPVALVESSDDAEVEPLRKKQLRKSEDKVLVDRSISKKRHDANDDEGQGEGKKRRRKKTKDRVEDQVVV